MNIALRMGGLALVALILALGYWGYRSEAPPPSPEALLTHFAERIDLSRDRLDAVGHSDKTRVVKELSAEWGCAAVLKGSHLLPVAVVADPVAWVDEMGDAHLFVPLYSEEVVLHLGPLPPSSLPD